MKASTAMPLASVVVISWNGRHLLEGCLSAVFESSYPNFEVTLVDNGSVDDTVEYVRQHFPQVTVISIPDNIGFGPGMNVGLRAARGELVIPISNDVVVSETCLSALVQALTSDPQNGLVGCKAFYPDGQTLQHAGGIIRLPQALPGHYGYRQKDDGRFDQEREVDYVTGAVFGIKRHVLEEVDYFDESFSLYFEDTDLCYSVREAGYKVIYSPHATVIHLESQTTPQESDDYYYHFHRSRLRFFFKHYTTAHFFDDFVPAERHWLRERVPDSQLRGLRQAYFQTLLNVRHLPFRSSTNKTKSEAEPTEVGAVTKTLQSLYEEILARQSLATVGERTEPHRPEVRSGTSHDKLAEKASVKKRPFVCNTPIIGPLVVRMRELWNRKSTRERYVQQLDMRLLDSDRDTSQIAHQVAGIGCRLDSLEARLDRIETLLQQLTQAKAQDQ